MLLLIHSVHFWVTRIDRKYCWSWPTSKISYFLSSTSFIFPSTCQSITFKLKLTVNSQKSWNLFFLHRTWSPDWPNVAKILLVLIYLDIPNRPSWKQYFWIRLSRCDMTVTSFWMFLRWNKFWLPPLDWNVDELNMQKGSINFVDFQTE